MIAVVEEIIDDAVDEALAASDMDTSLFVPIGVEEIREGTVRTEIIEDRDTLLTNIAAAGQTAYDDAIAIDADTVAAEAAREAAISEQREDLLTVTTIVQREAEPAPVVTTNDGNPPPVVETSPEPEPEPQAIVVMSNADDKVFSTSGADDRFEVVPQVFMSDMDQKLDNQEFGRDVIVDLDDRVSASEDDSSSSADDSSGSSSSYEVDQGALGDVIYLEGVNNGIAGVEFERYQVGREGMNSLKIKATVTATSDDPDLGLTDGRIENAGEVNIFKQFDPLTDRFAVETLEISDASGNKEYWSLSTSDADREGGRVTDTYIQTDVSNTGKGILIGSGDQADKYVVTGDAAGVGAQVMVTGFDSSDTIDVSSFAGLDETLVASLNGDTVEVGVEVAVLDADGEAVLDEETGEAVTTTEIRATLMGTGLAEEDLSTALILSES